MALRLQISCMDSSNLGFSRTNLVLKKVTVIFGSDKKSLMLPSYILILLKRFIFSGIYFCSYL